MFLIIKENPRTPYRTPKGGGVVVGGGRGCRLLLHKKKDYDFDPEREKLDTQNHSQKLLCMANI